MYLWGIGHEATEERWPRTVPCTGGGGVTRKLLSTGFLLKIIVLHLCVGFFNPCVCWWGMSYIGGHCRLV